jgi:hypothetical protein
LDLPSWTLHGVPAKEPIMLRVIDIFIELALLMIIVYSFLEAVKTAIYDFGLNQKYRKFIESIVIIFSSLALVFFASHLIAFYPRLSPGGVFPSKNPAGFLTLAFWGGQEVYLTKVFLPIILGFLVLFLGMCALFM